MKDSRPLLIRSKTDFPSLARARSQTLQVNLGYRCNLSCVHCHVNAGPSRTEQMSDALIQQVLDVLAQGTFSVLDLTGGAPEMHPHFRDLVQQARAQGVEVIDRCNLTILNEPGYEDLVSFLASQQVRVVASLPCYLEENVEQQRGKGVYHSSMAALEKLNQAGYGQPDTGLMLDLVYNPVGATLPPPQESLQADYKRELAERFGVHFNQLLTITNMPISRFGAVLLSQNRFDDYMALLREHHNPANLASLMCRTTISVDYQGQLYDCDFNQMLDLPMQHTHAGGSRPARLADLLNWNPEHNPIAVADHCFGCTAGAGSSCGGALS